VNLFSYKRQFHSLTIDKLLTWVQRTSWWNGYKRKTESTTEWKKELGQWRSRVKEAYWLSWVQDWPQESA
jgi:hypothetical protein